jgi:hypothetical protein
MKIRIIACKNDRPAKKKTKTIGEPIKNYKGPCHISGLVNRFFVRDKEIETLKKVILVQDNQITELKKELKDKSVEITVLKNALNKKIEKEMDIETERIEVGSLGASFDKAELTLNDRIEWYDKLKHYIRFIPNFEHIQELDDEEFMNTVYLFLLYSEGLMDTSYFRDDEVKVSTTELETVAEWVFNRKIKEHQSLLSAKLVEDHYVSMGFSFLGYIISDVKMMIKHEDFYSIDLDVYYVAEDEWNEVYGSLETVFKSIDSKLNTPQYLSQQRIVLKETNKFDREGKPIYQIISKKEITD